MATERMAEKSEDREFLQQQVQRLNSVLSQYQKKYLPPSPEDEQAVPLSSQGPHASWLTDKRLLAPLLTEYDSVISQLQHSISTYQTEFVSLNSRVEQVTAENARLYRELRESVEGQLAGEGGEKGRQGGGAGKSTALVALQTQLTAISKDRDGYRERWRQTAFELEHLQTSEREKSRELEKCKSELVTAQHTALSFQQKAEELQRTCVKLNEERNVCVESAQAGEREVEQLVQALTATRSEFQALQIRNTELLRVHNELTVQFRRREAERQQLEGQGHRIDGRVHLLELSNTELEAKLVAAQSEVAVLSGAKAELEERVSVQQSRLAGLEREVHEAVGHVKESMEMVESAILDKDQAVIVSQQQAQEAERLRAAMNTLLQEAGQRTRREVDAVREEYNKNIDKMAEEIQKLEEECGQKQALVERARREKKAAEKELQRVRARQPEEAARVGESLQQLRNRVQEAERAGEQARRRMENALVAQQAAEASLAEEKRHREEVCGDLGRRVREGEEAGGKVREERIQLAGQLQKVREQLRSEAQTREEAEARAKQELAAVIQHYELRERELLYRLQSREQTHSKSTTELRELLTSQYRMSTKWREESKSLSHKFEETISNLRDEVSQYRRKSEGLTMELETLKKSKEQHSQHLQRLQSSQASLQRQLKDAETRADAATSQVSSLLLREQHLLAERRQLQRQLDKIKLEIARRAGMSLMVPGISVPPTPSPLHAHTTPLKIPPGPLNTTPTPLDAAGWGQALSSLRQSIRQVRQEMEDTQTRGNQNEASNVSSRHPFSGHKGGRSASVSRDGASPETSILSEHSSLCRADLSTHSHTSNTVPT